MKKQDSGDKNRIFEGFGSNFRGFNEILREKWVRFVRFERKRASEWGTGLNPGASP